MNNKEGKIIQDPTCIRRLFSCISLPLAILESIIRSPKNAEPLKAIHNILLNPLKGACDSFSNFFFNFGSIFDINYLNYKIKSIGKYQYFNIADIAQRQSNRLVNSRSLVQFQLSAFKKQTKDKDD